jgi:hypothetical protein
MPNFIQWLISRFRIYRPIRLLCGFAFIRGKLNIFSARLLLSTVFFVSVNGYGQDLFETVDYINNLLKLHTHNLHIPELENGTHGFDKISVDSHGKIQIQRYIEDEKTGAIMSKGQTAYAYLKSLELGSKKDISSPPPEYKLSLLCHSQQNCVTYQFGSEGSRVQSELWFSVDNIDVRERLKNALQHLLELSKANNDFYEKDPFANK